MKKYVSINGRKIGPNYPPYIIAELSANHNGDINRAFEIMEKVAKSADAIKIQTYTPDTITIESDLKDFQIQSGIWKGQTLHDLYKSAHLPWEWHKPLFEKARDLGITMFSTPFDFTAVDFLENLDVPAYKVASFEIIDLPLIKKIAETKKPIIMSTGMATREEIYEAIDTAQQNGCTELVVLHCVSGYPALPSEYNLRTIQYIQKSFDVLTGLSDHTIDNATAIAAVAMGACVVEKHVTLDRKGGGADDSFSLEPAEFSRLCIDTKTAWKALGEVNFELSDTEKTNLKFRRSLYVVSDIKKGDLFTKENVKSIRPGFGISPKHLDYIIGKVSKTKLKKGTPITLDIVET